MLRQTTMLCAMTPTVMRAPFIFLLAKAARWKRAVGMAGDMIVNGDHAMVLAG